MPQPLTIIGSFVSPYVRKVLACMNLKGLDYEVDPITPFFGNDEFERLSPLRRIPVLIDGDFSVSDSSRDLRLSRRGLSRPPAAPAPTRRTAPAPAGSRNMPTRGSATSSSGACSTRRSCIRWSGASPATRRGSTRSLNEDIPAALDYLEGELPAEGFLFGEIGVADIAIASFFRNGAYAGFEIDAGALAAHRGVRRANARPPVHRRAAAVRGRSAQRRHQGPPPGAARRRRAADRDDAGRARAAQGDDAALLVLVAGDPVLEPRPQRPLGRE